MQLRDRINDDMKTAMRAKDTERLSTIRMLTAAIKQKEVDERIEITDAHVLAIVDKMIKQRRDAIAQFEVGNRQDLADKERTEIDVLAAYMPSQLTLEEIAAEVAKAVSEIGAAGPQDMGKVMGALKPRLANRADMTVVSAQVKAALNR
ncbi:MAG TPA: GatB/YqeY domain-containing protein [Burkholderiaceae bacterium]|nr:GatB/YqeY domain-containing protein [Burkholderiaceae bacterium]